MSGRIGSGGRLFISLCAVGAFAISADAQVDQQRAQSYFNEARALCERDGGKRWGISLCGPMSTDGRTLIVPAPPSVERTPLAGDGWTVSLAPGWVVRPGPRAGDYQVVRESP